MREAGPAGHRLNGPRAGRGGVRRPLGRRRGILLLDGAVEAGTEQRLALDGAGLPSGVYVVRAVGATFADARIVSLTR